MLHLIVRIEVSNSNNWKISLTSRADSILDNLCGLSEIVYGQPSQHLRHGPMRSWASAPIYEANLSKTSQRNILILHSYSMSYYRQGNMDKTTSGTYSVFPISRVQQSYRCRFVGCKRLMEGYTDERFLTEHYFREHTNSEGESSPSVGPTHFCQHPICHQWKIGFMLESALQEHKSRFHSATTGHGQMSSWPSMGIAHLEPSENSTAVPNDLFLAQDRSAARSMITSTLDPNLHTYGHADSQAVMSGNPSSPSNACLWASTEPVRALDASGLRHGQYPDTALLTGPGEQLISASSYGYHSIASSTVDASSLVPLAQESYLMAGSSQVVSGLPSISCTLKSQDDSDCWMEYIEWDTMDEDRKSGKFNLHA